MSPGSAMNRIMLQLKLIFIYMYIWSISCVHSLQEAKILDLHDDTKAFMLLPTCRWVAPPTPWSINLPYSEVALHFDFKASFCNHESWKQKQNLRLSGADLTPEAKDL